MDLWSGGRSEADEGHHPLDVIVITENDRNEAAAQGPMINYQNPRAPF